LPGFRFYSGRSLVFLSPKEGFCCQRAECRRDFGAPGIVGGGDGRLWQNAKVEETGRLEKKKKKKKKKARLFRTARADHAPRPRQSAQKFMVATSKTAPGARFGRVRALVLRTLRNAGCGLARPGAHGARRASLLRSLLRANAGEGRACSPAM